MKISYSKLSVFKQCSFKYKCLYIDGLWHLRKDRPPLSLGSSLHLALKEFFEIKEKEKRTLENLHLLLDKNWISKGFESEEQEQQLKDKGKNMLTRFYQIYDPYLIPYSTEKNLEVKIDDLILSGRIDRIDKIDGGFEVIDYKSGKPMEDEEQDLQITLYYMLLQNSYLHITPKRFSYHYLESTQKITFGKSETEVKEGWNRVKGIVRGIRLTKEFKPNPNKFCDWCDFKEMCPLYKENKVQKKKETLDFEDPAVKELWI